MSSCITPTAAASNAGAAARRCGLAMARANCRGSRVPSSSRSMVVCCALAVEARRAIDLSRELASARWEESCRSSPLFIDPYAEALAGTGPRAEEEASTPGATAALAAARQHHVAATKFIDECLLNGVAQVNVNRINKGDYRQVVLVGDAMDTRPFRLPWPEGTVLFVVAPPEVHELAEAVLQGAKARVPRGCLLRRVNMSQQAPTSSLVPLLERAGFRGDRLSLWALQAAELLLPQDTDPAATATATATAIDVAVITGPTVASAPHTSTSSSDGGCSSAPGLPSLLAEVSNLCAFHSLLAGHLPRMGRQEAEVLLADCGLLASVVPVAGVAASYGRVRAIHHHPGQQDERRNNGGGVLAQSGQAEALATGCEDGSEDDGQPQPQPWLFTAQQLRLSLQEMGVYEAHSQAAGELDEDFFGNFS